MFVSEDDIRPAKKKNEDLHPVIRNDESLLPRRDKTLQVMVMMQRRSCSLIFAVDCGKFFFILFFLQTGGVTPYKGVEFTCTWTKKGAQKQKQV